MGQISRNRQMMQKKWKDIGFLIFQFMINNTCLSSICYNHQESGIRASQKLCRASKNHQWLAWHGKLVLKIMSAPDPWLTDYFSPCRYIAAYVSHIALVIIVVTKWLYEALRLPAWLRVSDKLATERDTQFLAEFSPAIPLWHSAA